MPKNVENFMIRALAKDDYAQAAEIFSFVHDLHRRNRPDIYRQTDAPLSKEKFFEMCDDPNGILLCAVRVCGENHVSAGDSGTVDRQDRNINSCAEHDFSKNTHGAGAAAARDGEILGISCTFMRKVPGDAVSLPRIRAYMDDLAVRPLAQGLGIGTVLLQATEAEAKRRGAGSLELMVWSFNESAIEFYEKAGMTPRSVVMEKKL